MFQSIKKYLVSSLTVIFFVAYVVYQRVNDAVISQNTVANLPSENNVTEVVSSTDVTASVPAQSLPAAINTQVRKFVNQFEDDDEEEGRFVPKTTVPASKPTATPAPATTAPSSPAPTTKTAGIYKDGTYTGSSVFARDGYLQTQAIIQGGKLTDVKFPVLPNGSGYSASVSSYALPILRTEAIQAQSANVNAVSQATLTSASFNESLGVALASAKK